MKLKLENGDILYYLGEARTLRIMREERSRARVKLVMDLLLMWAPYEADYEYRREQLEKWYRREAAAVFEERRRSLRSVSMFPFRISALKTRKAAGGAAAAKGT